MSALYIRITLQNGVVFQQILFLVFFFRVKHFLRPQRFSITGSCYCNLVQQYIIPALRQRQRLETTVFMQDGAPSHIAQK